MARRSPLDQVVQNLGRRVRNNVERVARERVPADLLDGVDFSGGDDDEDDEPSSQAPRARGGKRTRQAEALGGLAFNMQDPARNLACACAAYRAAGAPGDVVAQHRSGAALFGSLEQCKAWAEQHGLTTDSDWQVEDDAQEILRAPYDDQALAHVVRILATADKSASDKRFKKFHWGTKPVMPTAVSIPGITKPLTLMGVARRIDYGADKANKWEEYFHEHGEEDGNFPCVYQLDAHTYVVHGPHMTIEERGIVN